MFCKPNTFDVLNESQAFTKLRDAGVLIEVQVVGKSLDAIDKIRAKLAGVRCRLGAVCYDHAFMELSAPDFAAEVKAIRAMDPKIVIGAYCAYPMASNHEALAMVAPAPPRLARKRRRLDDAIGATYRPRKTLMRCVNSSTFARFTTSVGTMICFVSGMNERSPRTACAIRVIA